MCDNITIGVTSLGPFHLTELCLYTLVNQSWYCKYISLQGAVCAWKIVQHFPSTREREDMAGKAMRRYEKGRRVGFTVRTGMRLGSA